MDKYISTWAFYEKKKDPNRYRFEIYLNAKHEGDIIKEIESHINKSEYIKNLVRKDIEAHK